MWVRTQVCTAAFALLSVVPISYLSEDIFFESGRLGVMFLLKNKSTALMDVGRKSGSFLETYEAGGTKMLR